MTTTISDTHITLAHGNGGRYMRELIEGLFAKHLGTESGDTALDTHADAVTLNMETSELLFTTDGFTVQPLEFPGGDIGSLAVHGTCNDIAVAGGLPRYLSLNAFIEEGLEVAVLDRLIASLARAAQESGVRVVAGDTKVLRRGEGGGLYLATTGIGTRLPGPSLSMANICTGDAIIVSGPVGDHGISVMLAREQFGLRGDVRSDAASVLPLTRALLGFSGLRFMRDPTRGGLATVCHEIQHATDFGIVLQQAAIPIRPPVQAVCDMLGYDPMFLACEGRVVAIIAADQADAAVSALRDLPNAEQATRIGHIDRASKHVTLHTELGGQRLLEELEDDPLPRIC